MKKIVSFITAICMLGLSVPHLDSTYNSNYAVAEDNLSDFSETIPEGYFQNQKDLSSFVKTRICILRKSQHYINS